MPISSLIIVDHRALHTHPSTKVCAVVGDVLFKVLDLAGHDNSSFVLIIVECVVVADHHFEILVSSARNSLDSFDQFRICYPLIHDLSLSRQKIFFLKCGIYVFATLEAA